jgi:tetratricopeptide (TPR) repeat protein
VTLLPAEAAHAQDFAQYHSLRQIRDRYPTVREDHLRYLEKWSFVRPVARTNTDRYYGFQDLAIIRQVSDELESGASFRGVLRALVAARDGQLTLDFSQRVGESRPVTVVALGPRRETGAARKTVPTVPTLVRDGASRSSSASSSSSSWDQMTLAARYFREGSTLDEGGEGDRARARVAYRKALLLDPNMVPALVNLANIHYGLDELVEAQALYERAMHLDAECFEAYFNLGNIHHDLGRYLDALEHYRVSIGINPAYADAYFYLAVTLEKVGHSAEAKAHWRSYRDLAPEGEWIELAKEFSE